MRKATQVKDAYPWIVVKWAKAVQPRVIILENVEEFKDWGPLDDEGMPCRDRKGMTFQRWQAQLRNLGYRVEWRELRACDYGTPTIRKRLFLVARRDGLPIVWPVATHANPKKLGGDLFDRELTPWRTAAECIDWSVPCPSIFDRKKLLAENTLRRVAAGLRRFVIDSPEPFIVNMAHGGRLESVTSPLTTVATEKGGCRALVTPYITKFRTGSVGSGLDEPLHTVTAGGDQKRPSGNSHAMGIVCPTLIQTGYGERRALFHCIPCREDFTDPYASEVGGLAPAECPICGEEEQIKLVREAQAPRTPGLDKPLGTVVAGGPKHALVSAFLAKHYGGVVGHGVVQPIGTVTASDHHSLVVAHIQRDFGQSVGHGVEEPLGTVTGGGGGKSSLGRLVVALLSGFVVKSDEVP